MANETEQNREKAKLSSSAHNFPIVGIGASAGGLDAFKQMLEAIPVDSEMAYVVVQHLNPAHDSKLTEILSRVTNIPIEEITDEVKILPNHIYVMPEGKILTSVDGVLKLTPRDSVKTNLVIDIFFTSIAVVWESMAVGVVLSGTGADGTVGLKMIKEHGGITIVQDETAAYGDMPQSAVDAHVVDFVLSPEKIAAQLLKINHTYTAAHAIGEEEPLPQNEEILFNQMLQVLYQFSGVDFIHYKQSTIHRRIGRRMALHKRGDLADYLKFLRSDKAEQEQLYQDMLISVTSFFRDTKTFETLSEKVLPALLKSKPAEDAIRFWVAGCATGEEAYSIAICLHEYISSNKKKGTAPLTSAEGLGVRPIQIFASDLSETAINKARAGIYSKEEVEHISPERLSKYFTKTGVSYQVNKNIRDFCVFATHNFLKDPPFAKMDLISCRNVLIYMDSFLQKKALTTFHYALKENAILLLGKSEAASAASGLFTSFDKQHKIYSRKTGAGSFMQVATGRREQTLTTQNTAAKKGTTQTDFRSSANAILISKSPAAVIVNDEMDIEHIHGNIDPFLKHSPGKPSLNLLKMASGSLAFELRNAIHKLKTSKDTIVKEDIPTLEGGTTAPTLLITIEVIPLTDTVEPYYLILFTKKDLTLNSAPSGKEAGSSQMKGAVSSPLERDRVRLLEKELAHAREDMHSITEEMEAANEELQSANEELLSSNEEMQTLNEELETSKEELQSSNEELISLNQELSEKQEQFNAARYYSDVIVSTIKEPLLVLDKNLRIKSANQSFYKKFRLTEQETEGSMFYEMQNQRWNNNELRQLLENILPQKSRIKDFKIIVDERTMLLNAREIASEKNIEQLILLAIEDVTDSTLNKQLQESEARVTRERQVLYNSFMNAPAGIAIFKGDTFIYEFANTEYENLAGRKITIGKTVQELFPEIEQQGIIEIINNVYSTGEPFVANEFPIELINEENDKLVLGYYNLVIQPLVDEKGSTERILSHAVEVTQQVEARKQIEEANKNLRIAAILTENIADAVVGTDMDYKTISWNKGAENLYGYASEEVMGKFTKELLCTRFLSDEDKNAWQNTLDATGKWHGEVVQAKKDGTLVCVLVSIAYVYDENGKPIAAVTVNRDITERKKAEETIAASEEKFRGLVEALPHLVWITDEKGEPSYASEKWQEYSGLNPYEAGNWQSVVHPDDMETMSHAWTKSLTSGEKYHAETRLKNKEGSYRWHVVEGVPLRNVDEKIVKWIGAFTDIHEQKLKEEQKDEFISIASHEMKTPLTTAKGYIELLLLSLSEENQAALYATKASKAVERLHALVKDLLDASKIQNGQLDYTITTFDFNKMVDEAIENFQHSAKDHIIQKNGYCSHQITGDRGRLQQVLINLFSNAVKYSPKADSVLVKIEEQENNIQVSIQDFGVGMSIQHLDKIFDRYYRVEEHALHFQGLGIGLYISCNIIDRHKGKMWAESKPEKGSTFHFTLPI